MGVIFHPNMESVQLMPGDVSEEFREVQSPQKLNRGVKVPCPVYR